MLKNLLFLLIFLFANELANAQTTFTWNGATSNSWNVTTNWTPNGVPASTDNVVIVTGSNPCTLIGNTMVNNFTLTSGTLNTVTYTFTINGNATLTTGTVSGTAGTIDCEGTTTTFGNTTTGPVINAAVIVNALTFTSQRTRYNNNVSITKLAAGSSVDNWRGGNTFNGNFYLNCASTFTTDPQGDIYIGSNANDPVDVFNGRATFYVTGCARIRVPQNGAAVFNGVTSFHSNGYGTEHDRIQPARTGTAIATFNDSTYFYCNSTTTDMQIAYDANTRAIFNGPIVATHYGPSAAAFMFGNDGTVSFNNNITLNCLGSGAITITTGAGTSTLATGRTISIGNLGFSSGRLDIDNLTQLGTTAQNFTLTGTAALGVGAAGKPCVFNANVNFSAPRISILASTFHGTSVFTKSGGTADDCGGNVFNNTVILNHSGSSEFRFSSTIAADVFASTLDINNTGTGSIRPSRTYNTTYPQNITINNTTGGGIFFGANGGASTLANNKLIAVGSGGYANGYLFLYKFSQASVTAQNLNLSGAATTLRMGDQANITSGCSFPGNFTASAKGIELTGNTFGGTTIFNQSGPTTTRTWGGNNFTGAHTINVSGAAGIQCSQLFAADSYSSTVNINLTNAGGVTLSRIYNTSFPENITLTGTSTGGIAFGFSGGESTLANGKTISIGGAGFTGSFLYLYKFTQIGPTPQSLTLTGTAAEIQIGATTPSTYGCTFNGNLTVVSPNILLASNVFNANANFTKTGGTDDNNNGNNTFNGTLNFTSTCPTSAVFTRMSNVIGADTYNGVCTFSTSCPAGGFVLGRNFNGNFNENIICHSTGGSIYFGAAYSSIGNAILAANKTITCGTFNAGLLSFRRFIQLSNTSQTITTSGTANIEYGGNTADPNTLINFEGALTTTSSNYIAITNSTFQRNATFTAKYYLNFVSSTFNTVNGNTILSRIGGTTSDDLGGGNTINGNFTFYNTGSGRFRTGVTAYGGDLFNGNVDINNAGTGTLSFAYNNGTNVIGGNLNLISTSTGSTIFGEAATTNATTLAGTISAATGNYTNGTINLRYLTQNGGANVINGTSSAVAFTINNSTLTGALTTTNVSTTSLLNSTFNGVVNTTNSGTTAFTTSVFNADVITLNTNTSTIRTCTLNAVNSFTSTSFVLGGTLAQGNTFNNGSTMFTKNGTSNDDVNGGNVFNAPTTFNTSNATGRWRLAATSADDFNDAVIFNQQNTGVLSPAYDFTSTFAGNLSIATPAGTFMTFAAGAGRAIMDGGNAQTISKTSGNDPNFNRLTLNKTADDVTLNTRINIGSDLLLSSGLLNTTSANIVNMNNGSSTTIGNSSSYINGPMNYDMAVNGARTLNFPIGKVADWRPAVLRVTHNNVTSYTYNSEVTNADAQALGYTKPTTVDVISQVHYWDIIRSNTSTSVITPTLHLSSTNPTITLYYGANDYVTDPGNLTVCKNTYTASGAWIDIGGTGATMTAGSVSSTSSPSAFNSFSRFTLGNKVLGVNPLPVELLYFDAKPNDKTVSLVWATASEVNNDHYEIERSIDGINFEFMANLKAYGDGNSLTKQTYNIIDENPYKGVSYYRLKQVDKNTEFKYANIVSVEFNSYSFVNVFPNPASNTLMIKASDDYNAATIKIINNLGVEVIANAPLNYNNGTIDLTHLASGIYYVVIQNAKHTENIKVSIQK